MITNDWYIGWLAGKADLAVAEKLYNALSCIPTLACGDSSGQTWNVIQTYKHYYDKHLQDAVEMNQANYTFAGAFQGFCRYYRDHLARLGSFAPAVVDLDDLFEQTVSTVLVIFDDAYKIVFNEPMPMPVVRECDPELCNDYPDCEHQGAISRVYKQFVEEYNKNQKQGI